MKEEIESIINNNLKSFDIPKETKILIIDQCYEIVKQAYKAGLDEGFDCGTDVFN